MKRPDPYRSHALILAVCFAVATAFGAGAPAAQVTGQSLTKLEVPGKISSVMWTRRQNSYTLQINRLISPDQRRPDAAGSRDKMEAALANLRNAESIQIWLLHADGSHISPTRRWETSDAEKAWCISSPGTRCLGYEISFAFHSYIAEQAVAVAMSFGDMYLIQKLDQLAQ